MELLRFQDLRAKDLYALPHVPAGDLVHIVSDADKTEAHEKYFVTDICSDYIVSGEAVHRVPVSVPVLQGQNV